MSVCVQFFLVLILLINQLNSEPQLDLPQYSTPNPFAYPKQVQPGGAPIYPGYAAPTRPPGSYQPGYQPNPPNLNYPGGGVPNVPYGTPNPYPGNNPNPTYGPPPPGPPGYGNPNTYQGNNPNPNLYSQTNNLPNNNYGYPNAYSPNNGYTNPTSGYQNVYSPNNGYANPTSGYQNGNSRNDDYLNNINNYYPNNNPNYGTSGYRDIQQLLNKWDLQGSEECTNNVAAQWNFETNVNQITQLAALQAQQQYTDFQHHVWDQLKHISPENFISDPRIYRQLRFLSAVGPAALPPDQLDRYNRLINDMLSIYNSASVCAFNEPFRCGLRLQPDLTLIMARSRDWDELAFYWAEWRRLTGTQMRDLYQQLIDVSNKAAQFNNYTDTTDYWNFPYESPTFRLEIEDVWNEIKPVYELLHAYVRRKLRDFYGPERINAQAPLPAHILGNMWAQSWSNILDITVPYPGKNFLDVTQQMIEQGYTPIEIFRLAEEFFVSMNMTPMTLDFWHGSIIEQPIDLAVICQPSAWDFCNRVDYRIKMCTKVNMKDLITAHHEMAHIQYFLHYRNQPKVFRDGANPGFHEAVGDAIGLSVATPQHMQTLGLVSKSVNDLAHDVNYLYSMALDKLTFLPFALIMDKWRWDIFDGSVSIDEGNCHWTRLREQYAGIKPPVLRSESDFDPGSKYHVPANIPYIRYFVGTVLQFQIYRAMCRAAGQFDPNDPDKPLHKCDVYRSKEAGRVLSELMKPGSSIPWSETLFRATGESRLDGSALRDYFRPLEDWLRSENLRTGEYVGWLYDGDYCKQSLETANLQVYGGFYNSAPYLINNNFNNNYYMYIILISFNIMYFLLIR